MSRISLSTTIALPHTALALTLAAACSSAAPDGAVAPSLEVSAAPSASASSAPPPARSHAGEALVLSARALPPKLVLDGAVADWGLDPSRNAVAIGVDSHRVVVAITWAEATRPALSLALANAVPMVPSIGWSQRGGSTHDLTPETCQFEQIPLIEGGWANGKPHPPEVTQACMGVLARYEHQKSEYHARFIRRLYIDGDAVALLDAEGKATPLVGAVVRAQRASAEVELPLTALPDLSQAPLASIWADAAFGEPSGSMREPPVQGHPSSEDPPTHAPEWVRLDLAEPVDFGTMPAVLAAVFADASSVLNGEVMMQLSYAPAKPEIVTSISVPDVRVPPSKVTPKIDGAIGGPTAPDRPALALSEAPLFETIETHGALTIGRAQGTLVTLVGGKLVGKGYLSRPDTIQPRGADYHLLEFDAGGFNWSSGYQPPSWRAVAIHPDGALAEDIIDEGPDFPGMYDAWEGDPTTFHNADWTSFGMRGKRHGRPKTITWTWDASQSRYTVQTVPEQNP